MAAVNADRPNGVAIESDPTPPIAVTVMPSAVSTDAREPAVDNAVSAAVVAVSLRAADCSAVAFSSLDRAWVTVSVPSDCADAEAGT